MKRTTFILISFLLAGTITVNAQWTYGAKAGLNIADLHFTNDAYTTSSLLRFHGGLWTNYSLQPKYSLQAELYYSGEGTHEKLNGGASGDIFKTFLHLPVLFRYNVTENFYAEAGPQIGLLLSSRETFNATKNDIKKYYKGTDFRVPFGIGYKFGNQLQGLAVSARYSFSLSPINKVQVGGGDLKSQVISIGVQYELTKLIHN